MVFFFFGGGVLCVCVFSHINGLRVRGLKAQDCLLAQVVGSSEEKW